MKRLAEGFPSSCTYHCPALLRVLPWCSALLALPPVSQPICPRTT